MPRQSKYRDWCYTLNNPTNEEIAHLKTVEARYHIFGKERGDSGTPHLQGYVSFLNRIVFTSAKRRLCPGGSRRIHIEVKRGTHKEASDYCCKEDQVPFISGTLPMTNADKGEMMKETWRKLINQAKAGKWDDIIEENPYHYIRYHSALHKINKEFMPRPDDLLEINNYWLWGPTGSGKSHRARVMARLFDATVDGKFYTKNINKWWCNIMIDDFVIVIDDWELSHHVLGHHLKIWGDKYYFGAEVKGGMRNIRPLMIIVTSNYSIDRVWEEDPEMRNAIKRRYKSVNILPLYGGGHARLPDDVFATDSGRPLALMDTVDSD